MKTYLLKNRMISIVSCFLVTVCVSLAVGTATPVSEKTRALMEERVKTLEQLVMLTEMHYQAGRVLLDSYLSAENDLLDAKLALASDRKTRIALRRKSVKNLTMIESIVEKRVEAGTASKSDHLRARAGRLEAEIELAQEMEKPGTTE